MRLTLWVVAAVWTAGTGLAHADEIGTVHGYVFSERLKPLSDVRLVLKGVTVARTDADGFFAFTVEPGKYPLEFRAHERNPVTSAPVRVEPGVVTELLLVYRSDAPEFEIEQPEGGQIREAEDQDVPKQTVTGQVSGPEGRPVADARIIVRGTSVDARTEEDGRFEIQVPLGRRQVTVIHPNYATGNQVVELKAEGAPEPLSISLQSRVATLAELVVTVPELEGGTVFVLKERQESSNVAEILGADQISKAGDSDAASALARVTGITIVGGRFVYVRGLGERYSSTMLNGSTLPSTSPERRVVPLDLFPASIISAIEVQKNYSPDLPGEFGGGVVKIRTKDIPDEFTLSLNASTGFRSGTTFQTGTVGTPGSSTDWLGFGASERAIPFEDAANQNRINRSTVTQEGLSATELERFGESFDTYFAMDENRSLPPDFGFGADVGGKLKLGKESSLGALFGFTTGNSFLWLDDVEERTFSISEDGTLVTQIDVNSRENNREVTLTGIGSVGLDITENHQLRLTSNVNRISKEELRITRGQLAEFPNGRVTRNEWVEEMLFSNQFAGKHLFPQLLNAQLEYRYMLSLATRDEPDRQQTLQGRPPGGEDFIFNTQDGSQRFFSFLDDFNHDFGLDWSVPYRLVGDLESKLKFGFAGVVKERDVIVRRFQFRDRFSVVGDPDEARFLDLIRRGPIDQLFTPETLASDRFELNEITQENDNYRANARVWAGYLMTNLRVLPSLRFQVGARVEASRQEVNRVNVIDRENNPFPEGDGLLTTLDVLPSVSATWEFVEDMQLRLAFARTVNRPTLRELSPATILDISTSRQFRGNLDLERAFLNHLDLRWEWYPSPGESVSVAAYGKMFENPIELTANVGAATTFSPINIESGITGGVEFEYRKNFGFLGKVFEPAYMAGNFALIGSQVDIGDQDTLTNTQRPLQGQSPYTVNLQLGYENLDTDTNITVLFNVFGPRIDSVGLQGVPDVYEQPVPRLDLVASQRFGRFKLGLKAQNIINPRIRFTQEEPATGEQRIFEAYTRGFRVGASMSVDLD